MKKAINLIINYFLFLLLGLIFGIILYTLYLNSLGFISGKEVKLFTIPVLLKSGIYVAFCLVFLICPIVSYYRVRHPAGLSQTIAYVIICLITWFGLFPGLFYANKAYNNHFKVKSEITHLSEGYFRPGDEKVYFFTKEFQQDKNYIYTTTGIVIDTSEDGKVTVENINDDFRLELNKSAQPYKEVQVKHLFDKKGRSIPIGLEKLVAAAKRSYERGIFSYLSFLSLAVLICMLYSLSTFFEWKLLNTTLIVFITSIILSFNSLYYSTSYSALKNKVADNRFFEMLSGYIYEPVIFVINNLVTLIFIIILVVRLIVKKHKNKNR